jgi:TolB-like protein
MGSGMTDPDTIAALGRQLGATYVVAGTITRLGNQNLLIIAILHTENLRQIAGDMQTYTTIEEIDGKLPAMARNIAAAVKTDTSRLPLLALPPVQLAGGADSREADALAQILAARLLRSGKYAVYPRTKSLEQVQEEYGNQFSGDTADEYLPDIGRGTNPRLVLSVTARRLGARSMFNAAVINLETGIQEAGDTVDYRSLEDGIDAMDDLARKLTGQGTRAEEAARAEAEAAARATAAAATAARVRAEQEAAAKAAAARYNLTAGDTASFTQAIATINNDTAGGQYNITLNGSFTSNSVTFTGNAVKTITIKGDVSVRTISNNGRVALFDVPAGITLVLDNNVTLDGNNQKRYIVSVNSGALVMKSGSTVRGSKDSGVYVNRNGAFTMSGGTISGNTGGGVGVGDGGAFTMSGGTISGNAGFGVYVDSAFTMSGGTISGNTEGGVYMRMRGGAFTMSGGTISGNTASDGGGVYTSQGGTFTMTGGTISGNTASNHGGGVYVYSELSTGTFIKSGGGTIDNTNTARNAQRGNVVFVNRGDKRRNTTAGPGVNLDSRVTGSAGGWE